MNELVDQENLKKNVLIQLDETKIFNTTNTHNHKNKVDFGHMKYNGKGTAGTEISQVGTI